MSSGARRPDDGYRIRGMTSVGLVIFETRNLVRIACLRHTVFRGQSSWCGDSGVCARGPGSVDGGGRRCDAAACRGCTLGRPDARSRASAVLDEVECSRACDDIRCGGSPCVPDRRSEPADRMVCAHRAGDRAPSHGMLAGGGGPWPATGVRSPGGGWCEVARGRERG